MSITIINPPSGTGVASSVISSAKPKLEPLNASAGGAGLKKRNDLQPALKIVEVSIAEIKPAKNRVRKPSSRQVCRVKKSIETFGLCDLPLLDVGLEILDGHSVIEAAKQLGMKSLRCVIADGYSDPEKRALRIALNRIQERGEWDEPVLRDEFIYLLETEFDLTVTGFEVPEIDHFLILDDEGAAEAHPLDQIVELVVPDADAVTRPGDIWELAPHRILCGNARDDSCLAAVIDGATVSAVFTDHPYNVAVNGHVRVETGKFAEFAEASGEMSDQEYEDFLRITTAKMEARLKPGGILFLCIDWRHAEVLMRVLRSLGLELLNICVWHKDNPGMGSFYRSQHEFILVARRPGAQHMNNIQLGKYGRNRSNIWRYAGATGGRKSAEDDFSLHPTVKPIYLVRDAILDVTAIGEVVLDPFLGSGTTILAAELAGRVCCGVEISPAYVDVAIQRWEKMTGREAIHLETGMSFSEMRVIRAQDAADTGHASHRASGSAATLTEEDF